MQVLINQQGLEEDAASNAGVTPLMMAVQSGDIQVVAKCLNNNFNPFLKDALGRTALDYASHYKDMLGEDMKDILNQAMD